jgi:heptosyltransferase-2
MKVLVWQTAFLGDLVLTSNLLLNLHKNFPNEVIYLVAQPFAVELFKDISWLGILPFDKTLRGNIEILKTIKSFDLAISPHRGLRTALTLFLAGIKERISFDRAEASFLYTKRARHEWGIHEVERNQRLLQTAGLKVYTNDLFLDWSKEKLLQVKEKFKLKIPYVVISPGANFLPKRWKPEYFARVMDFLQREGYKVVLTGGRKDIETAEEVLNHLKNPDGVINLVGETSIRELIHLIKGAELVVSNDSAPTHIAEAVGTKVITVYCATSSYYGFYPRRGKFLEPPKGAISCHPCKPNPKKCKTGTWECVSFIKPEEVKKTIEDYLR